MVTDYDAFIAINFVSLEWFCFHTPGNYLYMA